MSRLLKLRQEIDRVDQRLVKDLADRFVLTAEVGKYKKKYNMASYDAKREIEMLAKRVEIGKRFGLEKKLVKKFFRFITAIVREEHRKIMKK